MPKKQQRRSSTKQRSRNRRPVAQPSGRQASTVAPDEPYYQEPAAPASAPTPAQQSAPARTASPRRAPAARKTPTLTINYGYLRRDITTLAVLAPSMVVLVLIAYVFVH